MAVVRPFLRCCPCCRARTAVLRAPRRPGAVPAGRPERPGRRMPGTTRLFATALDDFDDTTREDARQQQQPQASGPPPWPAHANPTPYEILHLAATAPYRKALFYDHVKHYHPDRHHCVPAALRGLPAATLLERYRLLVAAHELLSSPEKRRRYDRLGVGWAGASSSSSSSSSRPSSPTASSDWRQHPGTAAYNATWEDWERWRQAQEGGPGTKQEPRFLSNGGFAVLVLVFVCLGSWGQLTRVDTTSADLLQAQDARNRSLARTLRQQQAASARLSRQDRVGSFLERREAEGWGFALPAPRAGRGGGGEAEGRPGDGRGG